ncbi:MAG: ABC transporter permease subunit [Pseudolabrys sp.]|nr:ABC transporter permease subunit [Pseudolabrys sp.]
MDAVTEATKRRPGTEPQESIEQRRVRAFERDKGTRRSVILGEKVARGVITVGGLLVIVAVIGIMVFLVRVVFPLVTSGGVLNEANYRLDNSRDMVWVNSDEFQSLATTVGADGRAITFHIPTGREVNRTQLAFEGRTATAVGGLLTRDSVAMAFEDGTVRFIDVGFDIGTVARDAVPEGLERLDQRDELFEGRIFARVLTGDHRTIAPRYGVGEPIEVSKNPIIAIDYKRGGTVERPTIAFATVDSQNVARISQSSVRRNLMTGAETVTTTSGELPNLDLAPGAKVTGILLSGSGDRAIVATDDGMLYRFDVRSVKSPVLAERLRVFPEGVAVTSLAFLSGDQALVVGGSDGSVDVFFRIQRAGVDTADGYQLVRARSHEKQSAPIVGITEAQRDKSIATLGADGSIWYRQSTADEVLFRFNRRTDPATAAEFMVFPRSNGVLLVDKTGGVDVWAFEAPHPEITPRVLFSRVWYEGYSEPTYTWQSTAGTDLAEPKYSLVPLIFGTIKATFYAMLFAVPLSLMGAIYTSEFVHRNVRATVKPAMEMMESLPTVVLGFLAALVLAPLVEEWIGAVLLAFISIPLGLMLGAFTWQTLPARLALRLAGIPKFIFMFMAILVAGYVAYQLGPFFEDLLFYGDFKAWTAGQMGTGTPFMFLLLLPLSFMLVSYSFSRFYGHHYRMMLRGLEKTQAGWLDFARWAAFLAIACLVSLAVASFLTLIGFDPRGSVIDSYAQRNALVVGFVMAFAVVPNIYTLAEDALNSVPGHLRAGSLAAGATPWQTAMWVVLPTAASGVFAAVMIGMGRAVGETMIVVMAAGNTPIMEWNIFSGLRTLSANIAIELPEAVKDGTNYRVLFLAALTLFVMTFVINTVAELIRQRFRKRAFQL